MPLVNEFGDQLADAPVNGMATPQSGATIPNTTASSSPAVNEFGDQITSAPPNVFDNLFMAKDKNPEAAAQAQDLSKKLVIPPDIIMDDVPKYKAQAGHNDDIAAVVADPNLSKAIEDHPEIAAIGQGQLSTLQKINAVGNEFIFHPINSFQAMARGFSAAMNQPGFLSAPAFEQRVRDAWEREHPAGGGDPRDLQAQLENASSSAEWLAQAEKNTPALGHIVGTLDFIGKLPGAVFGGIGEYYVQAARDINAAFKRNVFSEDEARGAANSLAQFASAYMIEAGARVPEFFPEVPDLARSTPEELRSFKSMNEFFKQREADKGRLLPKPEGEPGEPEAPKTVIDAIEPEKEEPKAPPSETSPLADDKYIPPLSDTAATNLQAGELPPVGSDYMSDQALARIAEDNQQRFGEIVKAVQESPIKETSPATIAKTLAYTLGDRQVYIPMEVLSRMYGDEEPRVGDKVLGWASQIEERMQTALATGADLQIPANEFAAHIDPTVYDKIKDDIRFEENGVSPTDAKDIRQKKPEDYEVQTVLDDNVTQFLKEQHPDLFAEKTPEHVADIKEAQGLLPQAQAVRATPGANIGRMAALLGPNLYDISALTSVTVKELFQNGFDAVKAIIERKKEGYSPKLHVGFDKNNRTISMFDNGSGMTPEVLGKQFLEIAGTAKETEQASGGLGIAKMLFAFGNSRLKVITLRDGVISKLETNGPTLLAAMTDPEKAPIIDNHPVTPKEAAAFPDGHGTHVEVDIPTEYKDTATGEMKPISFSNYLADHNVLTRSPLFHPIDVTVSRHPKTKPESIPIGKNFPYNKFTQFANVEFDWGTARIYVSKTETDQKYSMNLHVLSNGLWQFSGEIKANPSDAWGPNLNREIYVDVSPRVKPEESGYPFALNRQHFTGTAKESFGAIFNYISQKFHAEDLSTSARNFGDIAYLDKGEDGKIKVGKAIKLEPKVPKTATPVTQINEGDSIEVKDGKLIVNNREIPILNPKELKNTRINLDELKVDQSIIDPDRVILHDNLEVTSAGERVSLVADARREFGPRFDNYVHFIGQHFIELRNAVAALLDYPELREEGVGLSFDNEYYGVSIKVPFSGMFINPALSRYADPVRAAVGMVGTMIHELAHHKVRSHNADFPAEMQTIQIVLDEILVGLNQSGPLPTVEPKGVSTEELADSARLIKEYEDFLNKYELDKRSADELLSAGGLPPVLRMKLESFSKRFQDKLYKQKPYQRETISYDLTAAKLEMVNHLRENHDIYRYLSEKIFSGDAQTRGKRFKEASDYEQRDGGPSGNLESAGSAGLGPSLQGREGSGPPELSGDGGEPKPPETRATRAVKRERKYLGFHSIIDKGALNVTDSMYNSYAKLFHEQDAADDAKALERERRLAAKRQTPEWRANKDEVSEQVKTDLRSRPDIAADRYLRLGELPTGERVARTKLDAGAVKALGGEGLDRYTGAKGVHPDDLAPLLQFSSGKELVDALNGLENARKAQNLGPAEQFNQMVKEETDKRMEEQYGDLKRNINDEARAMATGEQWLNILIKENEMIAKSGPGMLPITKQALKDAVAKQFPDVPVRGATYQAFRKGADKMQKQAEAMLLKKNYKAALRAKQAQAFAVAYAKEAMAFGRERAKAERIFKRIASNDRLGSIDQEHFDHARQILARLKYGKPGQTPQKPLAQLEAESNGQLALAPWITDPTTARADMEYSNLTVGEFKALANSIKSLMNAGKEQKWVDSTHGKATIDNVAVDVERSLQRFPAKVPWNEHTYIQRMGSMARYVMAWHTLVERIFDYTDQFDPNGPLTRFIDRPLRESDAKEKRLSEKVVNRLKKLKEFVDNSINDQIDQKDIIDPLTGKPYQMTRQNLRYLIMHMGSQSGIDRVLGGFGIDGIAAFNIIRENATKQDFDWANGMHEVFEYLWSEAAPMIRRYTGVEPEPIDARPFKIKLANGTEVESTGGYAPAFYDKTRGNYTGDMFIKGDLFDKNYIPAVPAHSYQLPRKKNYSSWLDLDGTMMNSKIQQMIHDIAFRESVRQVQKILSNEKFMTAFTKHWGAEYSGLFHGWLRDIANAHVTDDSYAQGAAHVLGMLRQNVISILTAVNPGTILKHLTSAFSMSVGQVGFGKIARSAGQLGINEFLQNFKDMRKKDQVLSPDQAMTLKQIMTSQEVRDFILSKSELLRNRARAYDDTVRGAFDQATNAGKLQALANARTRIMRWGNMPLMIGDLATVHWEWLTAYKDALVRTGSDADAVFEADRRVARAHGSAFVGDRPVVTRAPNTVYGEVGKSLASLYNFWNDMVNNMFVLGWDTQARMGRGAGSEPGSDWKNIFNRFFLYAIIPIAMEELAAPPLREDKHSYGYDMAMATVRYFGGMFVGLRELTNAFAGGYEPSVGLMGYALKQAWLAGEDIKKLVNGKAMSRDWFIHFAQVVGASTGMAPAQVARTLWGLKGYAMGTENPQGIDEWRQLLRTGHTRPLRVP